MIFVGTEKNYDEIEKLVEEMHKEMAVNLGFDKEKVKSIVRQTPTFCFQEQERIVGILGLQLQEFWWTKQKFLADQYFFVKPDFRSYKISRNLLEKAKEYAIILHVPLVVGTFISTELDRKDAFYKRLGFQPCGNSYQMGL